MPSCLSAQQLKKIEQIEFYGGKAHLVDRSDQIYAESRRLAAELNGHYMDQFTLLKEQQTGVVMLNADSIYSQMKKNGRPPSTRMGL